MIDKDFIVFRKDIYFQKIFEINIRERFVLNLENHAEYISVHISLSRVITLEPLIKWWSWAIRLAPVPLFLLIINFHFSGRQSISCTH